MSTRFRRLIVGPLLALGTTAATLSVTALPTAAAVNPAVLAGTVLTPSDPASAAVGATVRVNGYLRIRISPTTTAQKVGSLPNRAQIKIGCWVLGQEVRGSVRTTKQWDRLVGNGYISHAYVNTKAPIQACPVQPDLGDGPNGSMRPTEFITAAAPLAQASQREYQVPTSVTIAQAILESGWGKSPLARNDKNFFGMKCNGVGPIAVGCHEYQTRECRSDGTCYETRASFRVYRSVLDSFRDHGRLLSTSKRYRPAFAFSNNADRFIEAVHRAGYATSPSYATDLKSLMKRYNLYQYNQG